MTAAVFVLALSLAGAGGTAVVMALRLGSAREEIGAATYQRQMAEQQLQATAREFSIYRDRCQAQLEALRNDIRGLENDLSKINLPGARRARINRLWDLASDHQDGDDPKGLSEGGGPSTGAAGKPPSGGA
jgi:hypothetical protein